MTKLEKIIDEMIEDMVKHCRANHWVTNHSLNDYTCAKCNCAYLCYKLDNAPKNLTKEQILKQLNEEI